MGVMYRENIYIDIDNDDGDGDDDDNDDDGDDDDNDEDLVAFAHFIITGKTLTRKIHHQATAKFHQLAVERERVTIPIVHGDLARLQPKV